MTTNTPIVLSSLSKREAITDAIYRAILAVDTNDMPMLLSAIAPGEDTCFEREGTVVKGADAIKKRMMDMIGPMNTTHTVSNIRVDVKDGADTAFVTATAVAQHYRAGEGADGASQHLLVGGLYNIHLVEDKSDGLWKIKKWILKPVWRDGDRSVMQPPS